ncbi:MAG: carbohydrate ABC transporter permease [Bauldia sp.]
MFAGGVGRYFLNSIIVSGVSVALVLALGSLAGYGFAKLNFRFNKSLFVVFLMGAMIPVHVTLIPLFVLSLRLGIYDSLFALIGPYVGFNLPVAIFILTEFFRQIPGEIEEAARLDGASRWAIFSRIALPLSMPALVTVGIFSLIFIWNEFVFALVLISDPSNRTLPLGLTQFYQQFSIDVPGVMAALTLATLPIVLLYVFAQERVISGLMAGAVKG